MSTIPAEVSGGGKRGELTGWSKGAVRRNLAFLRSIDETRLDGSHFAITLTLRDCPPTVADWTRTQRAFIKRMERAGMLRLHWVMELQRRGVPHLHGLIAFPAEHAGPLKQLIIGAWIGAAEEWRPGRKGQDVRPWDANAAWLAYLGKHVGRRGDHYQRAQLPDGWSKAPKVWGKRGDWPQEEPTRTLFHDRDWFTLRRRLRALLTSRARAVWSQHRLDSALPRLVNRRGRAGAIAWLDDCGDQRGFARRHRAAVRGLVTARRTLRCADRDASAVLGVSKWITADDQDQLVRGLHSSDPSPPSV